MPLLFKRPVFLPACLTLGALLCAPPAPAGPAPAPAAVKAQTITLQHVVPGDILKTLHWDQAAHLPEGVTRISALPATNSLSVVATPAGLAQVRQIVKIMDIAQRQVQIKFALANATAADLKESGVIFEAAPLPGLLALPMPDTRYAAGSGVASLLQTLTKRGVITQSPVITTSNNVDASLALTTTARSQVVSSSTFAATPRVNSDDSVTLVLHPVLSDGATKREIKTTRTVRSGDTMVITNLFPGAAGAGGQLLLFVTPTVLPTGGGTAVTVK